MERVAVVIPNWNGRHLLDTCLAALRRQTFRDFAAYLVDNGSTDGSVALVRERFPEVRVVAHPENRGFSAAMNAGIRASAAAYVVALNNDTEAEPGWLAALVGALDARPEIGFAASKILDFADRRIIDSVGDGYAPFGLSFKHGARERDDGRYDAPFEALGASAAAAIYRRAMLDEIGLFDEDFFAYMEDVDLSLRARLAGYRCLVVPDARIYHVGSASTGGRPSAFSIRLTTRNSLYVALKDMPAALLPAALPAAVAAHAAMLVRSVARGRSPGFGLHLRAFVAGLADAARGAPAMLAKRRSVRRRVGGGALLREMAAAHRAKRHSLARLR